MSKIIRMEWKPSEFLLLNDPDYIKCKSINMRVAIQSANYARLYVDSIIMKMIGDARCAK